MKKRIFVLLLTVLMLCCFFFACSPKKDEPQIIPYERDYPPVAVKAGAIDGTNSPIPQLPLGYDPWPEISFRDKEAPQEVSVEFQGETYTGSYERSEHYLTSYVSHQYIAGGVRFSTNADTGKFLSINFMTPAYFRRQEQGEDVENPEEFAISYAKELAAEYIRLEDYTIDMNSELASGTSEGVAYEYRTYQIDFDKMIGGIESSDGITVKISSRGELASFSLTEIDSFRDFAMEQDVTETVEAAIYALLKEHALAQSDRYIWTDYEAEEHMLLKTPEGKYGVLSRVDVVWYSLELKKEVPGGYFLFTPLEV